MLERLFSKLDLLPGSKTYLLAAVAAVLFWGQMVGIIPHNVYDTIMPWVVGLMAPTVALKAVRK